MAGLGFRGTAALAAGLVTLALAGCTGAGGERYDVETAAPSQASEAPAPTPTEEATTNAAGATVDLASVLLELGDIPLAGWAAEPPSDDDPTVDDETGGICTFELTEIMTAEQLASERGRSFSNEALVTIVSEYIWAVPAADDLVASVATQLAACAGSYPGTSGDTAVVITSEPLDLAMPGATTSVCRHFQTTLDGQIDLYGTICLGASGNRFLGVMASSMDPAGGITQEEYVTVLTTATGKAFAG